MSILKLKVQWRQALGELFIVFLGVLIALAVDQWNEARVDRQIEAQYLDRLEQDLRDDIEELEYVRRTLSEKRDALERLMGYVRSETDWEGDDSPLANLVLSGERFGWGILPRNATTFEDLRASGNLGLIRSATLRARIVADYEAKDFELIRLDRRRSQYPSLVWDLVTIEFSTQDKDAREVVEANLRDVATQMRQPLTLHKIRHELNYAAFLHGVVSRMADNARSIVAVIKDT